jgi:excinuclease ABC subunit B
VRGDNLEIFPAHYEDMRLAHLLLRRRDRGDFAEFDPLTGKKGGEARISSASTPTRHYVTPGPTLKQAIKGIKAELKCGSRSSTPKASCWRRSGWSSAPISTSK